MSEIEITQADREVAAEILKFAGMWSLALRVRAGKCDDNVTVECIARHRHEARAAALEEGKAIGRSEAINLMQETFRASDDPMSQIMAKAMEIATASVLARALRSGEREGE